jgi:hypothetical protein
LPASRLLRIISPVVLTATIVVFAAGEGSLTWVIRFGHALKWPMLLLLDVVALVSLGVAGRKARPDTASWALIGAIGVLALVSSTWSVDPRLTAERAISLVMLFVAAAALALSAGSDGDAVRRLLLATLAGAVAVGILGVFLLLVEPSHALASAERGLFGKRYLAFAGNPDTDSILFAVALPLGLWLWTERRSVRDRIAAGATVALLAGSIVASGSRGALLGAVAGGVAYVLAVKAPSAIAAAVVVVAPAALAVATFAVAASGSPLSKPQLAPTGANAPEVGRLVDEIGWGRPAPGSLLDRLTGSSGRLEAWQGALDQANQRPILGYGFGTEDHVFIDRINAFQGGRAENSYLGMYLQLGGVGLLALLALPLRLGVVSWRLIRLASPWRPAAAACAAGITAAFTVALFQSYLYAVGNVATISVWMLALLAASLGRELQA